MPGVRVVVRVVVVVAFAVTRVLRGEVAVGLRFPLYHAAVSHVRVAAWIAVAVLIAGEGAVLVAMVVVVAMAGRVAIAVLVRVTIAMRVAIAVLRGAVTVAMRVAIAVALRVVIAIPVTIRITVAIAGAVRIDFTRGIMRIVRLEHFR